MQIAMHIGDADIAEAFRSYTKRRLFFALGHYGTRVGQVTVRITANGSAVRCRISTEMLPSGNVAVEESDPDLLAAVDRATGRIGRLFGRELERARDAGMGRESIRTPA